MRTPLRRTFAAVAVGLVIAVAAASPAMADTTSDHTTGSPARSVVMLFKNNTPCNFRLVKSDVQHGDWWNVPPSFWWSPAWTGVPSDGTMWISSESNGYFTGTQGDVAYAIDTCASSKYYYATGTWEFNWNNPYVGSNSYSSSGTVYPLSVTWTGGSGNNAVLTVTINMLN